MKKMKRSEFVTYLNTTPEGSAKTFALLGIGITDYGIAYNPQVETEKWIIEDNARTTHESNQKQSSVSQKIYVDDDCYLFVKEGLDKLNYRTEILDIDMTDEISSGNYGAKLSDGVIAITNYMGEDATIEYDMYYDGDAVDGTVSFDASGKPTFTPNVSL